MFLTGMTAVHWHAYIGQESGCNTSARKLSLMGSEFSFRGYRASVPNFHVEVLLCVVCLCLLESICQ